MGKKHKSKSESGPSEDVVVAWEDRRDLDYHKLGVCDQNAFDQIDILLGQLSEEGKEYWETYYG